MNTIWLGYLPPGRKWNHTTTTSLLLFLSIFRQPIHWQIQLFVDKMDACPCAPEPSSLSITSDEENEELEFTSVLDFGKVPIGKTVYRKLRLQNNRVSNPISWKRKFNKILCANRTASYFLRCHDELVVKHDTRRMRRLTSDSSATTSTQKTNLSRLLKHSGFLLVHV